MAVTIDRIVTVTKSVLSAGFTQAALIGNFLTENVLVPADGNRTLSFANINAVGNYFGTTSNEYSVAQKYFKSYNNNQTRPGAILFSRFVSDATPAYMFSEQLVATATVTAIKALTTPTFVAHINGLTQTLTLVQADFASATGLTDIAAVIETALDDELSGATCSIVGTNQFMVTAPTSGAATSTITYCTGNVAALLQLLSTDAPTLSQGTPGGNAAFNMDIIKNYNPNWMALSYVTRLTGDASSDSYAVTVDLSAWMTNQDANYVGFWWEGGTNAQNPASTTNLRARLIEAGYGARTPDNPAGQVVYNSPFQVDFNGINTVNPVTTDEVGLYSAFYMGMGASINYNLVNGKINFAGKSQQGLPVNVTDTTIYDNLLLQAYNVYGQFAGRASTYDLTENGSVGGDFLWMDNIYDSVWLADQLQNSVATLISNTGRLPYNEAGQAQILAVLTGVVAKATANGVIEKGNLFDPEQVDEVIELVGQDVTPLLSQNGYYIYFPPITAEMRINRLPFHIYFIYTNGGAINQVAIGQAFVS